MNEVILCSIVLLKIKSFLLGFLVAVKAPFPTQVFITRRPLIERVKIQSTWIICEIVAGLTLHTRVSDMVLATHLNTSFQRREMIPTGSWIPGLGRVTHRKYFKKSFVLKPNLNCRTKLEFKSLLLLVLCDYKQIIELSNSHFLM